MKFIKQWLDKRSRTKQKEELMDYFSVEYRDKLMNEHRLVSAAHFHLQNRPARSEEIRTSNLAQRVAREQAIANLLARKLEIEAMIDVLTEFLEK